MSYEHNPPAPIDPITIGNAILPLRLRMGSEYELYGEYGQSAMAPVFAHASQRVGNLVIVGPMRCMELTFPEQPSQRVPLKIGAFLGEGMLDIPNVTCFSLSRNGGRHVELALQAQGYEAVTLHNTKTDAPFGVHIFSPLKPQESGFSLDAARFEPPAPAVEPSIG